MHNCGVLSGSSLLIEMPHFLQNAEGLLQRWLSRCQLYLRQADDEVAIKLHSCTTHGNQVVLRRTAQRMHVPAFCTSSRDSAYIN